MSPQNSAQDYVRSLGMLPHPEGGYYKETYRAKETFLVPSIGKERNYSTAIYYLLESGDVSRWHRIKADEMWHFYDGDTLEVMDLSPEGEFKIHRLGRNLESGESIQALIPAGHWFGARVKEGGQYVLAGCVVSPGFEFEDLEIADPDELKKQFPELNDKINFLVRES